MQSVHTNKSFAGSRGGFSKEPLAAGGKLIDWKLKLGNFLFKHRSFTPVPLIILVFIIFRPIDLGKNNAIINLVGLLISLLGEIVRVIAVGYAHKGTSGRESYLRADSLNISGIYSIVRNPLYIGNFFIFTGLVIVFFNIFAVFTFIIFLILQYYFVILAEENFLKEKYGSEYETYCQQVKRIIPTFKSYKKNQNPFNLKKVIFKESDSVFNMLVMYLFVLLYKERIFSGRISSPLNYIIPGGILIFAYVMIKIIKKRGTAKAREETRR
jgi:protein-S-isoprenylcysteine O-methyltransferase Ste14